ncbi:MAG: hypothetical protein SO098_00850, partial [Prevotella sp.]|nr:hypothetical protein [Prevotella sp.]
LSIFKALNGIRGGWYDFSWRLVRYFEATDTIYRRSCHASRVEHCLSATFHRNIWWCAKKGLYLLRIFSVVASCSPPDGERGLEHQEEITSC